jgi:hypothetical protein
MWLRKSLPLILAVSALLLSAVKLGSAESKNPRTNQHQSNTARKGEPVKNQEPQIPLAVWQRTQAALDESIASVKEQSETTKKQAEAYKEIWRSPSVLIQIVLAVITACFLVFAWLQWKVAERALVANIRPRISIEIEGAKWLGTTGAMVFHIPYRIRNSGKSPAFVAVHNEVVYVTDKLLPAVPPYGENFPSPEIPGNNFRESKTESRSFSQADDALRQQGRLKLYFIVRVVYRDEMKYKHETAICTLHDPTTGRFLRPADCPDTYFRNT